MYKVGWYSCGCSSLVACKLAKPDENVYIHVSNQHPDTLRFLCDSQRILGRITILQSLEYASVDDVIETSGYINGADGARCTLVLKKRVRQKWERDNWRKGPFTYVWGFDVDERKRAERVVESMPEFAHEFPLIDRGLTKGDCHQLCEEWGIRRQIVYDMGYAFGNCLGCVKGGRAYWNKIRIDFPEVFERRARQERRIGRSCIPGVFLDELPEDSGYDKIVIPSCSLECVQVLEEDSDD